MPDAARHRLIIASNRGPVTYREGEKGALIAQRGGGGLVTALTGMAHHHDVTWIAHALSVADHAAAQQAGGALDEFAADGSGYRLRFVGQIDRTYDLFYNTFANPLLWFVQHQLFGFGWDPTIDRHTHMAFDAYRNVNRRFATALIEECASGATGARAPIVMIHDYQLFLVPGMVREQLAEPAIHFFLHIPWPAPGAWRCLPRQWLVAIVHSLLACDILGVQTHRDADALLATVASLAALGELDAQVDMANGVVSFAGRTTQIRAYPISVNVEEFVQLSTRPNVARLRERIGRMRARGGSLIVRVDRTDPSKNILRGFAAYRLLLHEHPELHGLVTMFCQLDPSRQGIDVYARYLREIEHAAASVNEQFGSGSWQPLVLNLDSNFRAAVAAYTEYDVLYVNPVADGMNLVSKEGPLINSRDGVVVLSTEAGSHGELSEFVVGVNPFDIAEQADALHRAVTMDMTERAHRAAAIREQVRTHNVRRWIDAQLADLDRVVDTKAVRV